MLCAGVAGCCGSGGGLDGTIPIRGTVTYRGKPLEAGEVRYLPVDARQGRVARGPLDSRGRFRLTTLTDGDGALAGEYRIVVVVYEEQFEDVSRREHDEKLTVLATDNAPPIPQRYYKPETSGLTDTVNDDHSGFKEIVLVE